VATYARCGGSFSNHLAFSPYCKFTKESSNEKKTWTFVVIWQNYGHNLGHRILAHPVCRCRTIMFLDTVCCIMYVCMYTTTICTGAESANCSVCNGSDSQEWGEGLGLMMFGRSGLLVWWGGSFFPKLTPSMPSRSCSRRFVLQLASTCRRRFRVSPLVEWLPRQKSGKLGRKARDNQLINPARFS